MAQHNIPHHNPNDTISSCLWHTTTLSSTLSSCSTSVNVVDFALRNRDDLLTLLKSHMTVAQNRMKQHVDQKCTEREYKIGDRVYLKLHPYRQKSLDHRPSHKLAPRFYGPFQISAKIGPVAYHLQFPTNCKLNPVFHVSLLKPKLGDHTPVSVTIPPLDSSGSSPSS